MVSKTARAKFWVRGAALVVGFAIVTMLYQNCSPFAPALVGGISAASSSSVNGAPVITSAPADLTLPVGGSGSLSVSATGDPVYQWFKDGVAVPNETATELHFSNATALQSGRYYVVATNSHGVAQSADVAVAIGSVASDPGTAGDGDFKIGPGYAPHPDTVARPGVPHGRMISFVMRSTESTIYPGIAPKTGAYARGVAVYIPKQYVAQTMAPVMVIQDASYQDLLPTILDNYIDQKKLPVMILVFANSGGGDSIGSERGLEYDTVSPAYGDWVDRELFPRVEMESAQQVPDQAIRLSKDPEARGTIGGSSGGAAALTMAWFHPELYRKVISYSGTFTAMGRTADYPEGAWTYGESLIAATSPIKPIRMWFEVGEHDLYFGVDTDWMTGNANVAKAMKMKGYHYHFDFALGVGHVDSGAVQQTLPDAMLYVWRGFPIK